MSRRARIAAYGSVALLILAGSVCAVVVGGVTAAILATVLIGGGFVVLVGLVFLEVGLSEDRERERQRRRAERLKQRRRRLAPIRWRRRGP